MHLLNKTTDRMSEVTLRIPSVPENIRAVESFIETTREKFQIDDDIYGNIMVAVMESVNNAIIHGNKLDKDKTVQITCISGDSDLRFIVKDEGKGFSPQCLPDPTAPENLEKAGGRGVFLMKNLSDEVTFHEDGRAVELVFYVH